ncbi:MAG: LLM class flavin-dependent oxidoreductase [Pseudomonadales bacterium]
MIWPCPICEACRDYHAIPIEEGNHGISETGSGYRTCRPKTGTHRARLEWAEANGIPDAWFSDSGAPDTLTQIAALAHYTKTLRIGVAVTPVYTRSPSVLAASANVIAQLLPGRFIMGLGSSSQTIMGQWNGIPLDKPLTRVKETAQLVRTMLTGAKTDFSGATVRSHGYRQAPSENPPPIYIGCLRPNMIEMAAEVGDGVIFNLWPKSALPKMIEHVKIGAAKAGKDWQGVEVVNRAMVLVTDDKEMAATCSVRRLHRTTPHRCTTISWPGQGMRMPPRRFARVGGEGSRKDHQCAVRCPDRRDRHHRQRGRSA